MKHYSEFVRKSAENTLIEYIGRSLKAFCKEHTSFCKEDVNFITINTNDVLKKRLVKSIIIPKNMDYSSIIIEFNPREDDDLFNHYKWFKEKENKTKLALSELHYGTLGLICDYIEDYIEII